MLATFTTSEASQFPDFSVPQLDPFLLNLTAISPNFGFTEVSLFWVGLRWGSSFLISFSQVSGGCPRLSEEEWLARREETVQS